MMDSIKSYLLSILAVSFAVSILVPLLKGKAVGWVAELCGGLAVAICMLSPLQNVANLDVSNLFSVDVGQTEENFDAITAQNDALRQRLISEKTAAYILDKAQELGFSVTAEVQTEDDFPISVTITGKADTEKRLALQGWIADTLSIAKEKQVWNDG